MTRTERNQEKGKQKMERRVRMAGSWSQVGTFLFTFGKWVVENLIS